jgi:NADH dehydrogenase
MTDMKKPNIIIAGGGFAGIKTARELDKRGFPVTLISRDDHFEYFPQMYHAATGGVRSESALPLSEVLAGTKVKVIQDELANLDKAAKTVTGRNGAVYSYDELVIALGSVTNYFGIQGLQEFSYGVKSIKDAEEFKAHLHQLLVDEGRPDTHYVVIGAGPTGVELAGALPDYLRSIMHHHGIKTHDAIIDLIEAAPRVLPRSSEAVSAKVAKRLKSLGVNVMTGVQVKGETADSLQVEGQALPSKTVVWTAGVANNPFFGANAAAFELNKGNRVVVNEYLQSDPHIWVLGDNAVTQYAGLAETAIHNGQYAARQIARQANGNSLEKYRPKRPISVIPVGERWAVVSYGELNWYGWGGWVMRRLGDLVGYADIESWPMAIRNWLSDRKRQDNCPLCDAKN